MAGICITRQTVLLTLVALLLGSPAGLSAADTRKPAETDARLHADGKGWRLDRARIADPHRPRVLLVGDSILNGYLGRAIAGLDGRAYVDAWVNPYHQSEQLNRLLAEVLANGPYDVVHFNMGLHGWAEGRIKRGTFEPLTKAYVAVLRAKLPKARLIWASSTPVTAQGKPTELEPDINPIIVEHNRMAARVMAEMKVPVNDFYALLINKRHLARGDRFHWNAPAYELLANAVVESVLRELGHTHGAGPAASRAADATGVLVEAERFGHKGGWVVDQQFVDQMGSPYLLAHGMGRPVANAKTEITFPAVGTYRLWVRTRNWVPGPWDPPGRFKVLVNGKPAATVFGTQSGWAWQDGGVLAIDRPQTTVELADLTGFEGRCDALYFTRDLRATPPHDATALAAWRDRLHNRPATPQSAGKFDLVIVGGGIAGCAAALAADRQGLAVALVHDRPVLGGNASSEVRVHTLGIYGQGQALLEKIDTKHYPNGSADALLDEAKRHQNMAAAKHVKIFLSWRASGVNVEGRRIRSVDAFQVESGKTLRFAATQLIDATGDGWVGFRAGAEFRYGREPKTEFGEAWDRYGELWSPAQADRRVMGASVLWNSRKAASPSTFPAVPWAADVARGKPAVQGEWQWEYSADDKHQVDDAEEIRDHVLRAIYGSFAAAKQAPQYANQELAWVAYVAGRRESRRLVGDYIYTMNDMLAGTRFPDSVVEEIREIDVHYQRVLAKGYQRDERDFLSEALFRKVPRYYIPFRCLYSKNIANLLMAGRCFSCSHVGLGGPRVMRTCGQMGLATGYAASLCKKHAADPRAIYQHHLAELLTLVRGDGP